MSNVTPQWGLRRLAAQGTRIVKRWASESPAVKVFEGTSMPKAERFIAVHDGTARFRATWKKEMAEGRGAIAGLVKVMQQWAPLLKRDIHGFDGSIYGDKPGVPDERAGLVDEDDAPPASPLVIEPA